MQFVSFSSRTDEIQNNNPAGVTSYSKQEEDSKLHVTLRRTQNPEEKQQLLKEDHNAQYVYLCGCCVQLYNSGNMGF
jgi:hypothetical protein